MNEFTNNSAFALATKNAWGNTIISAYDIEMEVLQSSSVFVPTSVTNNEKLTVGKAYDLCELFKAAGLDFSNIVDYNFINEIPVSATVEGKMLTANAPIQLGGKIKMEYLAVDGETNKVALDANSITQQKLLKLLLLLSGLFHHLDQNLRHIRLLAL